MSPGRNCWLVVGLWLVAACGGSGSGGFDIQADEQQTIDTVTATQSCAPVAGTFICASGVNIPSQFIDPASGNAAAHADLILPFDSQGLPCTVLAAGGCTLSLELSAEGFPAGTTFVAASQPDDPTAPWHANSTPFASLDQPSHLGATVTIADLAPTYLAVLVFLPGTPVPSLSAAGDLGGFGADLVIVASPVLIDPRSSPTAPTDTPSPPLPPIP